MEGNECYKFSTIRNFITLTNAEPVRVIMDVGANVGSITRMMKAYFPAARIYACEPVPEYAALAQANIADLDGVTLWRRAITAQHLFHDDIGEQPRAAHTRLRLLKGTPLAGPGWGGGSLVVPSDYPPIASGVSPRGYALTEDEVPPMSLDEAVAEILARERAEQVDILKLDCEGCEHSALGSASIDTLGRLRFVVGEYHGISRFYQMVRKKLYLTHKVNLIGQHDLGAFFAERLDGTRDGILRHDRTGMLALRPWLCNEPIDWHLFDERWVLPADRYWHALD